MEAHPIYVEWDVSTTSTRMESTPELEQPRTPLSTPVMIQLDFSILDFFDDETRREVHYTSRIFFFTVGQLLDQEPRRRILSYILSSIRAYDYHPAAASLMEEQLLDLFIAPVENARIQGEGVELGIDVLFSRFWTEGVVPHYIDIEGIGGGGAFGGVPASSASIRELETVRYEAGGGIIREKDCMICMEEFEVGMEVKRMPCTHVFHGDCLTRWLESSRLCPLCRHAMPASTDLI